MEIKVSSTEQTKKLATKLAKNLKPNNIIFLYGDLGSGKTTFTKMLSESLGFSKRVQSPTFVVIRKYKKESGDIKTINHIDLYRLTNKEEVLDLGIKELITEQNAITIIEWPNLVEKEFNNAIKLFFEYGSGNEERIIKLENICIE